MANNCLVTKLKGVVDNDNLKFYNAIVTKANVNGDTWILNLLASGSNVVSLDVIGNGTFLSADGSTDYGRHVENRFVSVKFTGTGSVKISNKYTLAGVDVKSNNNVDMFDLSDLVCPSLSTLTFEKVNCDFDKMNITSLTSLSLKAGVNSGNIAEFLGKNANLSSITMPANVLTNNQNVYGDFSVVPDSVMAALPAGFFFYTTSISGDISTFGRAINTNQMSFIGTNVSGTLESFVQMARSKGRTEFANSEQKNWAFNDNITFNGNALDSTSHNDFSWTPTTITFNGVTINA